MQRLELGIHRARDKYNTVPALNAGASFHSLCNQVPGKDLDLTISEAEKLEKIVCLPIYRVEAGIYL